MNVALFVNFWYNPAMKKTSFNPILSVIVPVFNAEQYLSDCIKSIQKQTLKNIEIICVNDGSTDGSLSILQDFAKLDPRIKIINKQNSGYGDSMNIGFEAANGKYIGIVESDDHINRKMFKHLLKVSLKTNADIVKSDFFEFSSTLNKYVMSATSLDLYNKVLSAKTNPEIFNFKMNTWTGIYKKSFLEKFNIKHNTTPGASYQDNGFWFQTLMFAEKIVFVSKAFYHYKQDNPNSSINNKDKVFCMCDEYDFIGKILEQNPIEKQAFQKWFWVKKFHNYLYTYSRIADVHKPIFLERFEKEFKKSLSSNELDKSLMDKNNQHLLNLLLTNQEEFQKQFLSFYGKFENTNKSNKLKKLFKHIKLFGLKNTLNILKHRK